MSNLVVVRRQQRRGLVIPLAGTRASPHLIFPLDGTDKYELEDIARAVLAKHGVTDEVAVQAVVAKAEMDYERRQKMYEVRREVRRLLSLRFDKGAKLMQRGFRKWKEVFYPATTRKEV